MQKIFLICALFAFLNSNAQNVGIGTNTPAASSILDITSTNKGLLIPRMTAVNRLAIPSPANGLLVFQTDGVTGIYLAKAGVWSLINTSGGSVWSLTGNIGTIDSSNFIGTTDNTPLNIRVNNRKAGRIDPNLSNTFWGYLSGTANTIGQYNTAIGDSALYLNTTGYQNTVIGATAMYSNTIGNYNTANGTASLYNNIRGNENTASGSFALYSNTIGNDNTANGVLALFNNTEGYFNTAIGNSSLYSNTIGHSNTANGTGALFSNFSGTSNTASGFLSMSANVSGEQNAAFGSYSLYSNTSGGYNTATGYCALYSNTTGSYNTALGYSTTPLIDTINNWTGIGYFVGDASSRGNMVEIGNTSVEVIRGQVNWSTYSDGRVKDNIVEDVHGLDFINKLRPVTYNYNLHKENNIKYAGKKDQKEWGGKYDIEKTKMTGFIAQEVDRAAKNCGFNFSGIVPPSNENDLYSLRYSEFVVPLVKAVQELSANNNKLQQTIENQNKKIERLEKFVEKLINK